MHNKTKKNKNKYNLELLFDSVLEKSYKLRQSNPLNFDGQGFWQPIKKYQNLQTNTMLKNGNKYQKQKLEKLCFYQNIP